MPGATTVPNEALAEPFKERHHQSDTQPSSG